jgi:hypothetical protein
MLHMGSPSRRECGYEEAVRMWNPLDILLIDTIGWILIL